MNNTKPERLSDLERLSLVKLRNRRELILQRISRMERHYEKYNKIGEEEKELEAEIEQRCRRLKEKVRRIENDPYSKRTGFDKFFHGEYTDNAKRQIADLRKKHDDIYFSLPREFDGSVRKYHAETEDRLHGTSSEILSHLAEELATLRAQLPKFDRIIKLKVDEQQKAGELRAKVAAANGKTRQHSFVVRRQLPTDHPCPYCGGPLGSDYHADHIYPVAKGGRSTLRNMVNVCGQCNSKKGNKTLAGFIRQYHLNREEVEKRLIKLGKDF